MHTLSRVIQQSVEAAGRAAKRNREPLMAFVSRSIACEDIPNLGDYRPKGWILLESLFVDKSGWGGESEPALTVEQFIAKLKAGLGYAIIGEGPFQIYIGEFEKG